MRTGLFAKKTPGGILAVEDMGKSTGSRWFVDSTTGTDAAGYGDSPDKPVATLDYAIGLCTANKHDVIYVMPGHVETWTTTGAKVVADIAGVTIVGLGQGADRPTFTFTHTGATWTISANGVTLKNLLFVTGVDSVITFATVSGADCMFDGCEFRDTTDIEVITDLTVSGDRFMAVNCVKNGYTGGNANVRVLSLNGVDVALVSHCRFVTKVTTAVVGFVTVACTGVVVEDSQFYVSGTALTKNIVDTITGSKWIATNCYDVEGGYRFGGGSGQALASEALTAVGLANDAITAAKIAANAIGASEIADGAIDAATFAAGAVDAAALGADAITNAKIADNAIGAENIAADAITNAKIADNAIAVENIADGAITAAKIADGAIDAATFAAGAIDAAAIAAGAIDADAIADNAIDAGALASNAIEAAKIAADAITNAKIADNALSEEQFDADAAARLLRGMGVDRNTADVITGAAVGIFTIAGGRVLITELLGEVTTIIGAGATNTKFSANPTTGTTTDMCATADIDGDEVGSLYGISGTPADAMLVGSSGSVPGMLRGVVVNVGQIEFNASADRTGSIKFHCRYIPLDTGATVVAA